MNVQSIHLKNLFGAFDYVIPVNSFPNLTILTGANGSGKTVILKMLHELLGKGYHFSTFKRIPFDHFEVVFSTGMVLKVQKEQRSSETQKYARLTFRYLEPDQKVSRKFHLDTHLNYNLEDIPGWFQRLKLFFLPDTAYIDNERPFHKPDRLISVPSTEPEPGERILAVNLYASRLTEIIEKELAAYTEKAQRLDSTFPVRMLESSVDRTYSDEELFSLLNLVKRKRSELRKVGIFDQSADVKLPETLSIEAGKRAVLYLYLQDVVEKLTFLEKLKDKISLFSGVINRHFLNKQIIIDRVKGFYFTTGDSVKITNDCLSAGEQNLLIILYQLLFTGSEHSLFLIDEPEMSLHVNWQKDFLDDIRSITSITPFNVLVATHSPEVISKYEFFVHHLREDAKNFNRDISDGDLLKPSSAKQ